MSPQRIQRRRTKGWRAPEGAIYVGRGTKWGNPWRIEDGMSASGAVWRYSDAIYEIRAELAGHDLMCWCSLDQPCHADILLEIANGGERR